jgi:hypothetical protein
MRNLQRTRNNPTLACRAQLKFLTEKTQETLYFWRRESKCTNAGQSLIWRSLTVLKGNGANDDKWSVSTFVKCTDSISIWRQERCYHNQSAYCIPYTLQNSVFSFMYMGSSSLHNFSEDLNFQFVCTLTTILCPQARTYTKADPWSSRESQRVFIQMWILEEAFWAPGVWFEIELFLS